MATSGREEIKNLPVYPRATTIGEVIGPAHISLGCTVAKLKGCRILADTFRDRRNGLAGEVVLAAGLHHPRYLCRD